MSNPIALRVGRLFDIRAHPIALRQGAVLFVAQSLSNLLNYVYHVFMGRMLGPSEYGIFASLLAVLMLLSVPGFIIQTVMAHYVARFKAVEQWGGIRALVIMLFKRLSFYGVLVLGVIVLGSGLIASFLQLPSAVPVIVMASVLFPWLLLPIPLGSLQGLQRFGFLGANTAINSLLRVLVGVSLVALGLGASGALAASTISSAVTTLIALIPLWFLFSKSGSSDVDAKGIYRYSGRVLIGLLGFYALTNVDLIIVKHFFTPEEAGYYSAAVTLGKVILFLPVTVATVMFPKTTHQHTLGRDSSSIVRKSFLAVGALCAPVVLAYFLFPSVVVRLLYGGSYSGSADLIGLYGLAMALYALNNILVLYYLSIRNNTYLVVIMVCAVIEVLSLVILHASLVQVVVVFGLNSLLLLGISEIFCRGLTGNSTASADLQESFS